MSNLDLLIIQPYVPFYRVPLFEALVDELAAHDIVAKVAAARPSNAQAARQDESGDSSWLIPLKMRSYSVHGHWFRTYRSFSLWKHAGAMVVELGSACLDSSLALMAPGGRKVAVWGHVVSYDNQQPYLDGFVERWQMRASDHVFAYTPRGGSGAAQVRGSSAQISTLMNTVATQPLVSASEKLRDEEIRAFARELGVVDRHAVCFIGGLDAIKRVDLLAACADRLFELDPTLKVLVCGRGEQADLLQPGIARGQIKLLGFADNRLKALVARSSQLLLVPGRVGLLAVESFVLGLPILTCGGRLQAPEFEYLELGKDSLLVSVEPEEMAVQVLKLLTDPERLSSMQRHCRSKSGWPSLSSMVDRYVKGVEEMLNGS